MTKSQLREDAEYWQLKENNLDAWMDMHRSKLTDIEIKRDQGCIDRYRRAKELCEEKLREME